MSRLEWGDTGSRFYEAGVDRGVLYVAGRPAVVWNGLVSVTERTFGGDTRSYYIDGLNYLNVSSSEEFRATIEAYTYPDNFGECDGTVQVLPGFFVTQQRRKNFDLSYRTKIGNDVNGTEHAYKIHLIYNALASPSSRSNNTLNDSSAPLIFTWNLTTRPSPTTGYKPTAHIVLDSRYTHPEALLAIEDVLYGSDSNSARMPSYDELFAIADSYGELTVTDNGDGTFTVVAPTTMLQMLDSSTFEINSEAAVFIDEDSYTITS